MSIHLVSVRLQLKDDAPLIDLNFTASGYECEKFMEKNSGTFRTVKYKGKPPVVTADEKVKHNGERKFQEITVETHQPSNVANASTDVTSKQDDLAQEKLSFFSGNPFVEKTEGILHLYKQNETTALAENVMRSEMICMLAVPAALTCHDLLQFLGSARDSISNMRIIRDSSPNQYMVLLKFRSSIAADEFYKSSNGVRFNSFEPDMCYLAYVAKVEVMKDSEGACFPLEGHTELPTCPVCLERMDESVDGILTILCNHSFHGNCLFQWGDTSSQRETFNCPVCRHCQTPELLAEHRCQVCGKQQVSRLVVRCMPVVCLYVDCTDIEDLWICLICGHIGCGRYAEAHAYIHFQETGHTYSLQVGGQRVWDYAGDNYVHRLIQSKTDGKLVAVEEFRDPTELEQDEKIDAITLEYTYLLTSQLESQRLYFEEKMDLLEKITRLQVEDLEGQVQRLLEQCSKTQEELQKTLTEKQQLEKRSQQSFSKVTKLTGELGEEKELNKCLRENQRQWVEKNVQLEEKYRLVVDAKEKEVADLREQIRDLMFHFEAEAKLQQAAADNPADDIVSSHLEVGEAAQQQVTPRKNRRRNNK